MKAIFRYLKLNVYELKYLKDDKYRKKESLFTLIGSPLLFVAYTLNKKVSLGEYQLSKHFQTLKNASVLPRMYDSYLNGFRR